jgi:lipoprotein-anchoring transpeptidase ErfK/SrfK
MRFWIQLGSMALLLGSASPPGTAPIQPSEPAPVTLPLVAEATLLSTGPVELAQSSVPAPAPVIVPPEPVAVGEPVPVSEPAPAAEPVAVAQAEGPAPAIAPVAESSGVRVVVSLPLQKAYVFEDGDLLWTAPVSTGKRGHPTPTGSFPILQKKVHHRSSKYDNAPMPYMQRLTWYGIALHAGQVPGYPASHGCIRLPSKYARKLYDLTDHGTVVTITRAKPATAEEALQLV